ncbi:hypothetical protein CLAFUR4_07381 [Fulvia fulva]|nr:hypothetical protein CLAFUR4_07381 [Fulvia fulva]
MPQTRRQRMAESVYGQHLAFMTQLMKQDVTLRAPAVPTRPHCHCPNCGRIIEDDEEEDDVEEDEDEDEDEDYGDEGEYEDSEDSAEEADSDDEVQAEAHYLEILSDIRNLIKDPVESDRAHARPRPVENFDPDLIKRHSTYGGGRRKAHARTKSLVSQKTTDSRFDRVAKLQDQDEVPAMASSAPGTDLASPTFAPTAPIQEIQEIQVTSTAGGNETIHTVHAAGNLPRQMLTEPYTPSVPNHQPKLRKGSAARATTPTTSPTYQYEEQAPHPICPHTVVFVDRPHLQLFLRMFGDPSITATSRKRTVFNDIVAAMSSAGFIVEQSGRCAGSAVTFKDINHVYNGRTITFHRPHPEPRIPQHMLRKWGKRLGDCFGWSLGSFVERE